MRDWNSREISIAEMSYLAAQYLLERTHGTEHAVAAHAICADPRGIHFANLLRLLYRAGIPPSQFFGEVVQLWEDAAAGRQPRTSRAG